MAGTNSTPTHLDVETLNQLAARLRDHAETLAIELEHELIVVDLNLAARACGNLASLRFEVAELATNALISCLAGRPENLGAIHRDLFEALDRAER